MAAQIDMGDTGTTIDVNRRAPVIGQGEVLVNSPMDIVWRILSDIEHWPEWNGRISKMRLDGPVGVGTAFRWSSGSGKILSRLEAVEPPRRIAWSGRTMGIKAIHVYSLSEEGRGTRVRTEESFAGTLARILRRILKRTLDRALGAGLAALKAEAERQAEQSGPSKPVITAR